MRLPLSHVTNNQNHENIRHHTQTPPAHCKTKDQQQYHAQNHTPLYTAPFSDARMYPNPRKRPYGWHDQATLKTIEDRRWVAPDENTYVDLVYSHEFAKSPASASTLKRSWGDFQGQQEQAQATPHQQVYHNGRTTHPTQKHPDDSDILMTDAPPIPHVNFKPSEGYQLPPPYKGTKPKSILKQRLQAYEALPEYLQPQSPTVGDLSDYILQREEYDQEQEAKERAGKRVKHNEGGLWSPRPNLKSSLPQSRVGQPSLLKPTAPSLSLSTAGRQLNRAAQQQNRRQSNPQNSFKPTRPTGSVPQPPPARREEYSAQKDWKPSAKPLCNQKLTQKHLVSQSEAAEERETLQRAGILPTRSHVSPPRKTLTPVSKRISITPPRHKLSPKSPRRPTGAELYPTLKADYSPASLPSPVQGVLEPDSVRRIGGRIVGGFKYYLQQAYYAILGRLFGYVERPQEEIIAVETNSSGRKRRAVAAAATRNDSERNRSANMSPPGSFPSTDGETSTAQKTGRESSSMSPLLPNATATSPPKASESLETPPDSRPGSSGSRESSGSSSSSNGEQPQNVPVQVHSASQKKNVGSRSTSHVRSSSVDEYLRKQKEKLMLPEEYRVPLNAPASVSSYRPYKPQPIPTRIRSKPMTTRQTNAVRNKDVEALIAKAEKVKIESGKDTQLRQSQIRQKERQDEELAAEELAPMRDFKAEARLQTQKENEALRRQAEEEAAREALEEQRKAAEAADKERIIQAQRAIEEERLRSEAKQQAIYKNKLVRPLDPEWEERVAAAMSTKNGNEVLTTTPDGIELTRYNMGKILPQKDAFGFSVEKNMKNAAGQSGHEGWVDDEAVNAVFAMIVARKKEQTGWTRGNVPEIVAYNSGWYTNYKNQKGIHGIKTWSRRQGVQGEKLLRARKILFPVNTGAHWFLLVISPQDRLIQVLDSASSNFSIVTGSASTSQDKFFGIARDWLKMELGDKYDATEWTDNHVKSSQQANSDDCGIFTCINALAAAKGKHYSEVPQQKGMTDARKMIVAVLLNRGFFGDWEL